MVHELYIGSYNYLRLEAILFPRNAWANTGCQTSLPIGLCCIWRQNGIQHHVTKDNWSLYVATLSIHSSGPCVSRAPSTVHDDTELFRARALCSCDLSPLLESLQCINYRFRNSHTQIHKRKRTYNYS